jgi:sugar lactone lactonase YvrE
MDYLKILPNNRFIWTTSLPDGRASAKAYFPNSEGIDHRDGMLYFVSKKTNLLITLNLDTLTYVKESTAGGLFGNGSFKNQPDGVISVSDRYLYFTEDGGGTPGVYFRDMSNGKYYTVFQAIDNYQGDKYDGDETTGLAFSPDMKIMYACMQEIGYLFEIQRNDGQPFGGTHLNLKYHGSTGE